MLDILDEELTECAEGQGEVDMKTVQGYWRRRNEILSFVIGKEISEPQKIDLKPLCHTPIPGPTRLTDPNRVPRRETELGLFT